MPSRSKPHKHINRLYSRTLTLIDRDVEAIDRMCKYGEKLPDAAAKHLISYVKLLGELKDAADKMELENKKRTEATAKAKPTAELEAIVLAKQERGV